MKNNPWITDYSPTEVDADPCGNVEIAIKNFGNLTVYEKLGKQLKFERIYWKKLSFYNLPWRHTPGWEDKNSIEEIKQDLNKKLDNIEKNYKDKCVFSREQANRKFKLFCNQQDQYFITAKLTGIFPLSDGDNFLLRCYWSLINPE